MMKKGKCNKYKSEKHHQLQKTAIERQNNRIIKLLDVLQKQDLSLDKVENKLIKNLISGRVFSTETCTDIINCEKTGQEIYENMIKERLHPESTTKVFDPVKKFLLNVFKNAAKKNKVKMPDRVLQLSDDANLWRKIAIISAARQIDHRDVVGAF